MYGLAGLYTARRAELFVRSHIPRRTAMQDIAPARTMPVHPLPILSTSPAPQQWLPLLLLSFTAPPQAWTETRRR